MNKKDLHKEKSKGSRGYAGYFKGNYLRSLKEYMFAYFLEEMKIKYPSLSYKTEEKIYFINGYSYKPDFFIYQNKKLWAVVEVKDFGNKEISKRYNEFFQGYFASLGIKYFVFYKERWYNKINKKSRLTKSDIEDWKDNSIYDYRKRNNAHFGIIHNEKTRARIGQKTKERFQEPEFREKHKNKLVEAMQSKETRKRISEKQKNNQSIKNPKHTVVCPVCGEKKLVNNGEYLRLWKNNPNKGCCLSCTKKLKKRAGVVYKKGGPQNGQSIRKRLKKEVSKIHFDNDIITQNEITNAKRNNVIANNSPLSVNSLYKYFNTVSKEDILNESN